MANSVAVIPPGMRILDANGNPISGAKLKFFDAATTTPKTVFADAELSVALGTTVFCDAGGYPVTMEGGTAKTEIYVGISSYKIEIADANDVQIAAHDNKQGALDTSLFEAGAIALPSTPVLSRTANDSIDVAERATLFNCNPTGGSFVMTLPSAVTAGDGWRVGIRHNGTANQVIIASVSSQAIRGSGPNTTSLPLVGQGEAVWLVSNGADWTVDSHVRPLMRPNGALITITDRITSAPVGPTAGARYIVSSAFSTFEVGDVIEADGAGGFIEYDPQEGWLAYVLDEDAYYKFTTAWALLITDAASQAEMEAGSATDRVVTPGRQHFHPSSAKFWAAVTVAGGVPTLAGSYNVASITDSATGLLTLTFTTGFASTAYCAQVTVERASTGTISDNAYFTNIRQSGRSTGSVVVECYQIGTSADNLGLKDPASWHVSGFGDFA